MPSLEELEIYRIVFELFDRQKTGYIQKHEVLSIAYKLGIEPATGKFLLKVNSALECLVMQSSGAPPSTEEEGAEDEERPISFGEFVSAFWAIQRGQQSEQKAPPKFPDAENTLISETQTNPETQPLRPPQLAKYDFTPARIQALLTEYGTMLPNKDVYCTPDPKVISFLK